VFGSKRSETAAPGVGSRIILDILTTVDVKSSLLTAGLTRDDVSAVRTQLLGIGA